MLALTAGLFGVAQAATSLTLAPSNLRRAPAVTAPVLGVVPPGTLLTVACQGEWCRTTYRERGGYVARSLLRPVTRSAPLTGRGVVFYRSCAAMRAAAAAPVRLGRPGYRTALDPNRNGLACDRNE